jgi:hypothetical protein
MSGNNSATGGYFPDTPPPAPPSADAVQAALQTMVSALTSLPGNLVRPRWQPMPPAQPDASVTWCAIGVTMVEMDNFPSIHHVSNVVLPGQTNPGYDHMRRHGTVTVQVSFYGPASEDAAGQLRDALYLPLNIVPLTDAAQMKLYEVQDLARVPEIINQQFVNRIDSRLIFRIQIDRTYPVFDLNGAEVQLIADHGEQRDIIVSP